MGDIVITTDGEVGSWSLPEGAACPRVGERFLYYFTPSKDDREVFAVDSLAENDRLHGGVWKVTKVEHHLTRTAWNRARYTTWVRVKKVRAPSTSSTKANG